MEAQTTATIYAFLKDYLSTHGYSPTVREVAAHFNLSHTTILKRLRLMERQGWIARREGTARSIMLLREPLPLPDERRR